MEFRSIKQQFRENKWVKLGALVPVIILLALLFFWVKSLFAPREPKLPVEWSQEIVSYWAFEEPSGQKIKDTAGQNSGRLGSSAKVDGHDPERAGGKLGSGLRLEGEDYALVPYSSDFDLEEEITLEAWVKPQGSSANENLWLPGWKYRKEIIINNKERDSFEDTQVKITLDTQKLIEDNKLQSDCADLRFTTTDKTTQLDWFIEKGCNSSTTEVWVKVPRLKAEAETPLYVYYGNFDTATQDNFQRTMESPPVRSWQWPTTERWREEKIFGAALDSEDNAIVGGYREAQSGPGQEWRTAEIRPDGRSGGSRSYEYSEGSNHINDVAVDSEDYSILAGFDTEQGDSQWRVKKRGLGTEDWNYTNNPSDASDRATAVVVDSDDNVIVGGYDSSPGDGQWRIEKLNSEGEVLWTYTKNPSSGLDMINDLAIDAEGNILAAGIDKSSRNDQWRLERISKDGDFQSAYLWDPSSDSDVAAAVEVDPEGNIILGGIDRRQESARWRIVKLNPEMESLWKYDSSSSVTASDEIHGMDVDDYGNIVVAGYDSSPGDGQWRVEKLDNEGERLWTYTRDPSSGRDMINEVLIDKEDNIILTGIADKQPSKFWVEKISEKKHYDLKPEVSISQEETFREIPSLIAGKLNSYELRVEENQIKGVINNDEISASLPQAWTHVMMTYDGSQQRLYLNSDLAASQALTGNINTNYNNLLFGFNFAGLIDEVKVYDQALTSNEVEQVYGSY